MLIAVALLALREGKPGADTENPPSPAPPLNLVEMEVLTEELAKLVARAEKAADRIEKGITTASLETPSSAVKATPKPESVKVAPKPVASTALPDSGSVLDDDTYLKAARLIKKGLSDEEVGRKVGLPPHEVKLVRKMMT